MKKAYLFLVTIFLINFGLFGQTELEITDTLFNYIPGEKIKLFTDRNIYCVNERIYFTAEYFCVKELDTLAWSKVLYVELIRWNGDKLAQVKLKLTIPSTSGSINIPSTILSGNYYLCAYTKWMRNFSPSTFAYSLIKIVNPFRAQTDGGPKGIPGETVTTTSKSLVNGISCFMNKNEYKPRERVKIELLVNTMKFQARNRYCVTVAKAGLVDTALYSFGLGTDSVKKKNYDIEYLPELRGLTISGKVKDKNTNLFQPNILVSLSEPKHGEYYATYQTKDSGRFVFSLPDMCGQHDFFIQAETKNPTPLEIKIDNDYSTQPINLPYVAFNVNKSELHAVKDMVINMQLNEKFRKHDTLYNCALESFPFYGSKKKTYFTEKYIELPTIEDFVSEIIQDATIKEEGGSSFIIIKGEDFSYLPTLTLMDNVQVSNDDQLLKIVLSKIERVEVITTGYQIGATKYNGIVSFYSKNKDFAGIDLNKNSMFFTYELFSDTIHGFASNENLDSLGIPDRKNLLYWNPDIKLSANKTIISFYTSDSKGDYVVYARGKNSKNIMIYGKCMFSVK